MSHEVESMAYSEEGGVPWHKLGVKVKGLMTAKEAIEKAGLDWLVETVPIFTRERSFEEVENWRAIRRVKDKKVYGVATAKYEPIQNEEAFQFFDEVVGSGQAVYETAGALQEGRRIWILANLKGNFGIKGDEIKKYVTLTNSHDGTLALQMFWTPIRVVCMNTLRMALAGAQNSFYARHTLNAKDKISAAREILGLANKFYDDWKEQARRLAVLALPAPKMPLLLKASFGLDPQIKAEDIYAPTKREMEKVEVLIHSGKGQDNPRIQGTAWQAYNGVAEYADYQRPYRSERPDARLNGAWFGSGADMKKRAWNFLTTELK